MNIWLWWKKNWPGDPSSLATASAAAGATLTWALWHGSVRGWGMWSWIFLSISTLLFLVSAAIQSNVWGRLQEASRDSVVCPNAHQ